MGISNLDHFEAMVTRGENRRLALVGGCFDPLHVGHIQHLWAARQYGELVVAVAPDSDVAKKHPPLLDQESRARILDALQPVKYVHVAVKGMPTVISTLQPQHYVLGADWMGKVPDDEVAACKQARTQIVHTETPKQSSTLLLDHYVRANDEQHVRDFEQLVLAQRATAEPWQPVTDYSLEGRRQAEGIHPQLIKEVFQPKRLLDVGCGPGHLVKMLRELGVDAWGYDVSVPECRAHYEASFRLYWEHGLDHLDILDDILDDEIDFAYLKGDLVICREVLEHLTIKQIRQAVRNLVRLSSKYVYVTTRFHDAPKHLLDVQTSDNMDQTHISMLSKAFLRTLFVLEGCKSRPDLEERMDWRKLGRCLVFEVQ